MTIFHRLLPTRRVLVAMGISALSLALVACGTTPKTASASSSNASTHPRKKSSSAVPTTTTTTVAPTTTTVPPTTTTVPPTTTTTVPVTTPAQSTADFAAARAAWIGSGSVDSAEQDIYYQRAELDLQAADINTTAYDNAINSLMNLVSLPNSGTTPAQQQEAAADFNDLDAFFGGSPGS